MEVATEGLRFIGGSAVCGACYDAETMGNDAHERAMHEIG